MTRREKRRAALIGVFILTCYAIAAWVEPCDGYSCHDQPTITE